VKRMHVVEEVSLLQPVNAVIPLGLRRFLLEQEFPPGPPIMVPPEEEESHWRMRSSQPPVAVPQGPLVVVPLEELVSYSSFFFSQKCRRFFSPFSLINVVNL
jgi:hypothetical protein